MQSRYFVAPGPCPVNRLLNRALRRAPADDPDSSIRVTVALRLRQLFRGSFELAEPFLHHRGMIFRLVVGVPMLVMLQTGCDIGRYAMSGRCDRRDAACGIGVAGIFMLFRH